MKEYLVDSSRPYTAVVFFTSDQMTSERPEIRLADLRTEYGLASKAFLAGPESDKIFFFEALLEDGQSPFAWLQVAALPTIVRIAPSQSMKNPPVDLPKVRAVSGDPALPRAGWTVARWMACTCVSPYAVRSPAYVYTTRVRRGTRCCQTPWT